MAVSSALGVVKLALLLPVIASVILVVLIFRGIFCKGLHLAFSRCWRKGACEPQPLNLLIK